MYCVVHLLWWLCLCFCGGPWAPNEAVCCFCWLRKERSGGFFKPLFADAKTVEQPQIYGGYGADTGR